MVFLNTGFAGPQLADVVEQEGIDTVLHDDEYAEMVAGPGRRSTVSGTELRGAWPPDRSLMPLAPTPAVGPHGDPHVGDDRTAEGRRPFGRRRGRSG